MSTFGYCKKLKKYEELDEDELLATLSPEELQELERALDDLDPDNNVPIGLRQKDQTAKTPTGIFDRDALLKYWENENKKQLEDEKVECNPGQVRWDINSQHVFQTHSSTDIQFVDVTRSKKSLKNAPCLHMLHHMMMDYLSVVNYSKRICIEMN